MKVNKQNNIIIKKCVACLRCNTRKILEISKSQDFCLVGNFAIGNLKWERGNLCSDIDLFFLNNNYLKNLDKIKKAKIYIQEIIDSELRNIGLSIKIGIRVRDIKELTCFVARMYSWFFPFKSLGLFFNNSNLEDILDMKELFVILTDPRIIANNIAETLWQIAYTINNTSFKSTNNQWYILNKYNYQLAISLALTKVQNAISNGSIRNLETLDFVITKTLTENNKVPNSSLRGFTEAMQNTIFRKNIVTGLNSLKEYDPLLYSGFHFVPKRNFDILSFVLRTLTILRNNSIFNTFENEMKQEYNIRCNINEFFLLDRELRHY